ncbi:MAG: 30S ribosomal protein S20 [Chloroflexi bacterium]|nr:30S ribosomal protein S20 [Chloroflexota bacterium]MYF78736.1 30S ribosomal protein S20 [Chloroflexota bacterium]MYK61506.1 30S ribosomal protein S20 [Chloroflexota bacterium]
MPAAKSMRVQRRRAARNRSVRSFVRTRVTAARSAIDQSPSDEATAESLRAAISALDVATRKGVIHRNQSSRKKSRLTKRLNKALAS